MDIAKTLSGGDSRALGRTAEAVEYVLAHPGALGELFQCLFSGDETIRMRAGDALEKVCRSRPVLLEPYADRLLNEVSLIDQPSVQWHLAQMIGEIAWTPAQSKKAIAILKRNLDETSDWIVLNYTLQTMAVFARENPSLKPYFIRQLQIHRRSRLNSVARRASKLLDEFVPT